jgi:hypothetical protein
MTPRPLRCFRIELALVALLAACGGAPTAPDANTPADGNTPADATTPSDASAPADASAPSDASAPGDASAPMDSATSTDAGSPRDAALAADSAAPTDASPPRDAASPMDSGSAECVGRPAGCVSGTRGGACGDAVLAPMCVAGSWTCPTGTIPITECACVGRPPGACVCTPSGWSCGDAGSSADSGARTFACGPTLTCRSGAQYCQEFNPGVPGAMRTYSCMSLPAGCGATPTCACLGPVPGTCSMSSSGDLTVRVFAP